MSQNTPQVLRHIAIAMDGNGRWAKERNLPRKAGHQAGADNIMRIVNATKRMGVQFLTLFSFSTENWGRPAEEVNAIMKLSCKLTDSSRRIVDSNVKIRWIGNSERLPAAVLDSIGDIVKKTRKNTGLEVVLAFNYSGRQDIVKAAGQLLRESFAPDHVTEDEFAARLMTGGMPDPDILIRTGGERRISNFLLWELAYTELYFSRVLWPDFAPSHLRSAVKSYRRRDRRFGRLGR